jgi:hypothetical protein
MRHTIFALLVLSCAEPDPGVCVALNPSTVEVRFRERDGKQSSKLAAQGTITRAENVVMSKPGAYQRRMGSELVETVSGAKELAAYSGALVTFSDTELKQRIGGAFTAPAASSLRWATVTGTRSIETSADQFAHSHVRAADGRDWHVWETVEGGENVVKYSVIDPTSGAYIVRAATLDSAGSRPFIVAVGTDIVIFYVDGGNSTNSTALASLMARKIAQATPTSIGSETTVENGVLQDAADNTFHASFGYDVAVSGSTLLVASRVFTGGATRARVRSWDVATMASLDVIGDPTGAVSQGDDVITFLPNAFNTDIYVAYAYTDSSRVRQVEIGIVPTTFLSMTVHAIKSESNAMPAGVLHGWRNITGWVDAAGKAHILAEATNHCTTAVSSSSAFKHLWYSTRTSAGTLAHVLRMHLGLASRTWEAGGQRYVLLQRTSYIQPTYYVADPGSGDILGRVFAGSAGATDNERIPFVAATRNGGIPNRAGKLPAPQVSGTSATIAVLKTLVAPTYTITGTAPGVGTVLRGAWTVTITPWVAGSEYQPAVVGSMLLIPGGAPREFDGGSIASSGFHSFPEVPTVTGLANDLPEGGDGTRLTAASTTTGSLEDGTYYFQLVFERLDARGNIKRSVPSVPFNILLSGGPFGINLRVAAPIANELIENDDISVVAYRTLKDAGVDAAYYRVAEAKVIANSYTTLSILDADGSGSQSIAAREQLYTDNGTIDNAPPFPLRQTKTWKDRVMGLMEENRRAFAWSKLVKPGVAVEWSDSYFFEVNDEYGDFTALSPLGSNFLLFKRDAPYWISGAGPDDTGTGQFSEPVRLDGVPGTERPRSVIVTDMGVWYQAPDNVIWLITPGLDAQPIGEPCADQTAAIVGTNHVRDKRQVRFHTASTTLVYDTLHKVWTTATGQASLACCMLGAEAHYLTTGAAVRKDSAGYTEAGTTYQAKLRLAWLSIAGLAGYQRVWSGDIVGEALGAYTLSAVLTSDFGDGTVTKSVASASLDATHGHRTRFHVPLSLQQKTSLQIELTDNSPSTAGGLWEGLNLQCGFAPGRRPPLPAANKMG